MLDASRVNRSVLTVHNYDMQVHYYNIEITVYALVNIFYSSNTGHSMTNIR